MLSATHPWNITHTLADHLKNFFLSISIADDSLIVLDLLKKKKKILDTRFTLWIHSHILFVFLRLEVISVLNTGVSFECNLEYTLALDLLLWCYWKSRHWWENVFFFFFLRYLLSLMNPQWSGNWSRPPILNFKQVIYPA